MKFLFVGDVVARPGRRALFDNLDSLRDEHAIDVVIVNVENAAGGFGVTEELVDEFLDHEIDVLSTGNHIWDKREALEFIERFPRLLRPANYPAGTPGAGHVIHRTAAGLRVGVINLMGMVFMHPVLDCPFAQANRLLEILENECDCIVVDFHAEASSEKVAMGWHLDGRVSAVLGSHTHVPTADERILPGGTAFISDVGMTGCYESVIGMNIESSLKRFVDKTPQRLETARGKGTLCGAVVEVDDRTGRGVSIERVSVRQKDG